MGLNCKSSNVLYLFKCDLCPENNNVYIGQTLQELHSRVNGHRSKFQPDESVYKQSALSYHCQLEHPDNFEINVFRVGLISKVAPKNLNRSEDRLIHKFRTHIFGLNRIEVIRWCCFLYIIPLLSVSLIHWSILFPTVIQFKILTF